LICALTYWAEFIETELTAEGLVLHLVKTELVGVVNFECGDSLNPRDNVF
jgi:hypothetical protein